MVSAGDLLDKKFVALDITSTVGHMIGALHKANDTVTLVYEGKQYIGMIDRKWLMNSRIDPDKMKLSNILKKRSSNKTQFFVPILSTTSDIKEICRLMSTADARALPVADKKGSVLGVVRAIDVINSIKENYANIPVKELASLKLVVLKETDRIDTAVNVMKEENVDRVPIVDSSGAFIGIATLIDLMNNVHTWASGSEHVPRAASHTEFKSTGYQHGERTNTLKTPVTNIMTPAPRCIVCTPEDTIEDAINMMVEHNISSIVLIRKEKPFGILTVKDIMDDFVKA